MIAIDTAHGIASVVISYEPADLPTFERFAEGTAVIALPRTRSRIAAERREHKTVVATIPAMADFIGDRENAPSVMAGNGYDCDAGWDDLDGEWL